MIIALSFENRWKNVSKHLGLLDSALNSVKQC